MTKQTTEDLTHHKMEKLLVGKVTRVLDNTRGHGDTGIIGICKAVHRTAGLGHWDVEFAHGSRFGFRPQTIDDVSVEGTIFNSSVQRRRVELVNPQQHPWRFTITAGPSREELFDSLRLYHERRLVPFTLEGHLPFDVVVQSIEVEDGSGNSWNLILLGNTGQFGGTRLKAYFHTKHRTGVVSVAQ